MNPPLNGKLLYLNRKKRGAEDVTSQSMAKTGTLQEKKIDCVSRVT
jgi:hypothetical protein